MIIKETGGLVNQRTNGDHLNYDTIEIGKNTGKSPGDSRGLDVTQTSEKYHQPTEIWKTLKE